MQINVNRATVGAICAVFLLTGTLRLQGGEDDTSEKTKFPPVFDKLIEDFSLYMADKDAGKRGHAVGALQKAQKKGSIPKEQLVPVFIKLLEDSSFSIRRSAAFSLSRLADPSALEPLRKATPTGNYNLLYSMVSARKALGDKQLVADLAALVVGKDDSTGLAVARVLGGMKGPEAIQVLLKTIEVEDAEHRRRAAFGLRHSRTKEADEALLKALSDADIKVRKVTVDALGAKRSNASAEKLLELSGTEKDPSIRQAMVNSLGLLRFAASREKMEELLQKDPDPKVRKTAAITLGSLGAKESKEILLNSAKKNDEADSVRSAALRSLARIRAPETIEELLPFLKDDRQAVRYATLGAMAQYRDAKLIPSLKQVLVEDKDANCRASAAYQLGRLKAKEAEEDLVKAFADAPTPLRLNVLGALQSLGSEHAGKLALEALKDKNSGIRRKGIAVLRGVKLKDAGEVLLKMAKEDKDMGVRTAAMGALPGLAPAVPAAEFLLARLEDSSESVRRAAYGALAAISKKKFPFRPWAYEHRRKAEVERWKKWWEEGGKTELEAGGK